MLDLSLAEVALVVVVAVIFIGPKELPVVVRAVAKAMRSLRSLGNELRKAFAELARESGLDAAKKEIEREVTMIRGDDGKLYESYRLPDMKPDSKE